MRVLVAGDRGYIGAVLVPMMLEAGHEVVGLDAGWYDGCDFGPQPGGYDSRTGDIRDQRPEDLAGFEAVVNMAAVSNDPVGHLNPESTYSVRSPVRPVSPATCSRPRAASTAPRVTRRSRRRATSTP